MAGTRRDTLCALRRLEPQLLLIDIQLQDGSGIDLAAEVHSLHPGIGIIMLTAYAYHEYVLQSLQAGARGYILKQRSMAELDFAMSVVLSGDMFLSPGVQEELVHNYINGQFPLRRATFTKREREVLQLIATGATTKDVAAILRVSIRTAENHRYRLMRRAGVHSTAELVQFAIENKILHVAPRRPGPPLLNSC
jgi:DNA-binding NarL/FixJ family response regulator